MPYRLSTSTVTNETQCMMLKPTLNQLTSLQSAGLSMQQISEIKYRSEAQRTATKRKA